VSVFDRIADDEFEQVVFCHDRSAGLRAIIAIHSTRLGPALGGTRFYPYATEDDALADVLGLARAMTSKAAAAGLDLGGGKAVIIGDPTKRKSEALLRAYARCVESLGGRYITAEDVGTSQADMDMMRRDTSRVVGVSAYSGGSGNPSPATAWGVLHAMRAASKHLWGSHELMGRRIVVSGAGSVGAALVRLLVADGASVVVTNRTPATAESLAAELSIEVAPHDSAHALDCDIWSPCALGGIVNRTTIPQMGCRAIVGAANNQLTDEGCAAILADANILYVPDYIANAGGLINVADELRGYVRERAFAAIANIESTASTVISMAEADGFSTVVSARRLVERRIREIHALHLPRRA
jgi:glutamate dehydrogenase/leucine dehydrogenase